MNKKTAIWLGVTVFCGAAMWALPQNAQGPSPERPAATPRMQNMGGDMGQRPPERPAGSARDRNQAMKATEFLQQANITPEKISEYNDLNYQTELDRIDITARIAKAEFELGHLLNRQPTNEKEIMKAVDALNEARGKLFETEVKNRLAVRKLLGRDLADQLDLTIRSRPQHNGPQGRLPGNFDNSPPPFGVMPPPLHQENSEGQPHRGGPQGFGPPPRR